jgi:peptidoglycan/xylan/chitin deacetylase (PgdA/CDA1 family)
MNKLYFIRNTIRSFILDILSINSLVNFKKNQLPCIQFVYFHSLNYKNIKDLDLLLSILNEKYIFISYSEAVNRIKDNRIDNSYLCISLDDGFKNNLNTLSIFRKYNISACFFICPSYIGIQNLDILKDISKFKFNTPYIEFMNWDDIKLLLAEGHEIGSHTLTHCKLSSINNEDAEYELRQSFNKIKEITKTAVHFAYPYGRYFHITPFLFKLIYEIGYISCASAERGVHVNGFLDFNQNLLIRRDHIMLDWKLNHILYFLNRNRKRIKYQNNNFPTI